MGAESSGAGSSEEWNTYYRCYIFLFARVSHGCISLPLDLPLPLCTPFCRCARLWTPTPTSTWSG